MTANLFIIINSIEKIRIFTFLRLKTVKKIRALRPFMQALKNQALKNTFFNKISGLMAKKEQQKEPGNTNAWKIVILPDQSLII